MKFVFVDQDILIRDKSDLHPLYELGDVDLYGDVPQDDEETIRRIKDADVVFFALIKFPNELLDRLPRLKVLQFLGTGVWNLVDVEYASKKGIKVLNVEGYGSNAVAEFAIASAMGVARCISLGDRQMRNRIWNKGDLLGAEIEGSTFGIVGTGNIGSLVAKKAVALGAKVLAYDIVKSKQLEDNPAVRYTTLEELFSESDFVSVHLKAVDSTYKIIDKRLINSMKKGAFFINCARAEVVDNDALYEALVNKRIRGAAIDAFEQEPPQDYRMIDLDNVVTTPHIGFYTDKSAQNMLASVLASVLNAIKELNIID